jgi:hypothetical protein
MVRWVEPEGVGIFTVAIVKKEEQQTPEALTSSLLQFINTAFQAETNFIMADATTSPSTNHIITTATYTAQVNDTDIPMIVVGTIMQHQNKVSLLTATLPEEAYDAEDPDNIVNQFLNSYQIKPEIDIPGWEQPQ